METTENQRKAADLLSMLRAQGMQTMAEELEKLFDGAWQEGIDEGRSLEHDPEYGGVLSPYKEMGR